MRWRLTRVMLMVLASVVSLLSLLFLTSWLASGEPADDDYLALTPASDLLEPEAFLYRLDPESGAFVTIPLPLNSRPADISVISTAQHVQIWFSEPGLGRIGRIVYSSSLDYNLTEFNVGGYPTALAANEAEVWFALPRQNQVGHINVGSGAFTLLDLPSAQTDPADIALDADGRAWVTGRSTGRLISAAISPTIVLTEHVSPVSGLELEGIAVDGEGQVWFTDSAMGYLWRLTPGSGEYLSSTLGTDSNPHHLALGGGAVWATLRNTGQLAHLAAEPPFSPTFYDVTTPDDRPVAIGLNSQGQIFFAVQPAAWIGQLAVTPTVSLVQYSLPRSDLKLTSLAVASDDSVWAVAHRPIHRTCLPIIMQNYDAVPKLLGIQLYGPLGDSNGFTYTVEAGADWVRTQAIWASIEPVNTTPDNYYWAGLDASLQTAAQAGMQVVVTIDGNPAWAAARSNGPVTNTADLQEFVGAVVARYPYARYWEFYNEPDYIKRFGGNGAAYAQMLQAIYPVVKAANPDAQVVMGGLALDWFVDQGGPFDGNFLPDVLANCAGPCFDVANFHYYPAFRYQWEQYGRDIIGKAAYVRQVMASYGYTRPVINTETGWPAASTWGSLELQARYVPKVYARGFAADLPITTWYALLDADSSNPGLLGPGMTPRPAFTAFKTLASRLIGARYIRAIPSSESGSPHIEGYEFQVGGGKRLDIYWYDCPSIVYTSDCDDTAPLTIQSARIALVDKMGGVSILNDADDGQIDGQVALPGGVGTSPIYVDYAP